MSKKRALLLRMGGIGDCVILTAVAKELHKRNYVVDYFCGSPSGAIAELFQGLPYLNEVKPIIRIRGVDCVDVSKANDDDGQNKRFVSVEIMKDHYDEVFDFKNSVEENRAGFNKAGGWRDTINSNYMNWIDMSLAWANIDYTQVASEDKVPDIVIPEKYSEWASREIESRENRNYYVIGMQLKASSLIRTFYKADDLPKILESKLPGSSVLFFAEGFWHHLTKFGVKRIEPPADFNPLLSSAAILQRMDCFISADSGMGHVAEALGVRTVTIYTTVPSWTRMKYYKHTTALNATSECHPCFTLNNFCPLEVEKAKKSMTQRESELLAHAEAGDDIVMVAKKYNSVPGAIKQEVDAAIKRIESLAATEPACVQSVTLDRVCDAVLSVLPAKKSVAPKHINMNDSMTIGEKH